MIMKVNQVETITNERHLLQRGKPQRQSPTAGNPPTALDSPQRSGSIMTMDKGQP